MPSKSSTPVSDETAVRTRAYLMWEADGRPDGLSDHYWNLAHAEVATPAKPKRVAASAKASLPEKKAKPAKAAKALAKPVKAAKPAKKKPKA